jgi:glycosyltransferase 2 family protein
MEARSTLWRSARRWLPGLVISIVAFVVLFNLVSFKELAEAFALIKLPHILLAVFLTLVSLLTRSLAWRVLLGPQAKVSITYYVVSIGYLFNNVFPLRAGEIARALLMGRSTGLGTFYVLSTIVIERSFDLIVAAGMLLATLPLALGMDWARPVAISTLFLVLAGLASLFLMANNQARITTWVSRLGKRIPLVERYVVPRIESTLHGFSALTDPRKFVVSLFWILVSWIIYVSIFYVLIQSIHPGAPFWWAAFTDGITALGVAIPSAPGGLGVYEAAIVGALSLLSVPVSLALAFALVLHFLAFSVTTVMGLIGLTQMGQSMMDLFAEVLRRRVDDNSPTSA